MLPTLCYIIIIIFWNTQILHLYMKHNVENMTSGIF